MNFGAILPDGQNSFVTIWPTGSAQPLVSSINPIQGTVVANAAIVPAGTGGSISVVANTGLHLYGDINGYFTASYNAGVQFLVGTAIDGQGAILGNNVSAAAGSHGVGGFAGGAGVVHGVQGQVGPSALAGSSGVHGINDSGAALAFGVLGEISTSTPGLFASGVRGRIASTGSAGIAVFGEHAGKGLAVVGQVAGGGDSATGVFGVAGGTGWQTFGVQGITNSTDFNSAGVKGVSGFGDPLILTDNCFLCYPAGVRGVDNGTGNVSHGVLGISRGTGTTGVLLATTGISVQAVGFLGRRFGDDPDISPDPVWAVYGAGNIGASGTKYFVEPHPTDPTLTIRYISLEGSEAGTYFRGRGQFQNGLATIEVPEDFRLVTDSEGLSVQVTPIGEMASVAVVQIGLDRIVVKGSRNVEFFYTVNGVRRTFRDTKPIARGYEFVPPKRDATIPLYLSDEQKRSLIANGTYKPDGTVNMETARRLGWDKRWGNSGRNPAPAPAVP
jgi:hypothetical protein